MSTVPFKSDRYHLSEEQLALLRLFEPVRPNRRRKARGLINPYAFPRLQVSQKNSRKTRRSRERTRRHSAERPQSHVQGVATIKTTVSNNQQRDDTENIVRRHISAFPIRLNTDNITVRSDSSHQIESEGPSIPRELSMVAVDSQDRCCCQMIIRYRADTKSSQRDGATRRDEVTCIQEIKKGTTAIVYKGFLKPGEKFAFKSQRLKNFPFHLRIEINDLCHARISSCCESKYSSGHQLDENSGLFVIEHIHDIQPCAKCRPASRSDFFDKTDEKTSSAASEAVEKHRPAWIVQTIAPASIETETVTLETNAIEPANEHPDTAVSFMKIATPPIPARTIEADTTSLSTLSLGEQSKVSSSAGGLTKPSALVECMIVRRLDLDPSTAAPDLEANFQAIPSSENEDSETDESNKETISANSKSSKAKAEDAKSETSSAESAKSTDMNPLIQAMAALFQTAMAKSKRPSAIPDRIVGNVEDFVIIWFGDKNDQIATLRSLVNIIRVIDSVDEVNQLDDAFLYEKLIFILPSIPSSTVLTTIHEVARVELIYFLSDKSYPSSWATQYPKLAGVYPNIASLRDHLRSTISAYPKDLVSTVITSADSKKDDSFTYSQLLKETLLCCDDESDLKKDMLQFCRIHYADNRHIIDQIDEYEKHFTDMRAIWWYTRPCFVSRVLARALRTQEIDLVFKMRHAIQKLHEQIRSNSLKRSNTVYSHLRLDGTMARNFEKNIGGLVIFGAFLPAMLQLPEIAESRAITEQIDVLLTIQLAPNCAAEIKEFRFDQSTIDVLINLDVAFRIASVDDTGMGVIKVSLSTVPPTDSHFKQLTESLRKEMAAPVVILQITKLLLATDHYAEGDFLTELIYQDKSFQGDSTLMASLAAAHHLLGNVDDERGDHEAARNQFQKSLRAFQLFLPPNHHLMSSSYNNIGSMYFKDDQYKEAIQYHQKALQCQLQSPSPDLDSIATYTTNIGAVYFSQKNYSEALKHLKRAEKIFERTSSADNVDNLLTIYQKVAACYWRTNRAKEALEYYQKTLDLQIRTAPNDSHSISVTYFNLSTAYARLGQIDEAVQSAEKSVEELKKIYPPDHPEVKENEAQLELVKQKKWLQEVLAHDV